eukprot:scaffold133301_cov72-Phaeocystis_antarctica.AAC.6
MGCGRCAATGGGGSAVAALARGGLRWLPRWRTPRCGARRQAAYATWVPSYDTRVICHVGVAYDGPPYPVMCVLRVWVWVRVT